MMMSTAEIATLIQRARAAPGRFGTDPVEATVPGHPLNDTEDGDRRTGRDHRPRGATKLRVAAIRVGADQEERGNRAELERQSPGRAGVEGPAGKHGLE